MPDDSTPSTPSAPSAGSDTALSAEDVKTAAQAALESLSGIIPGSDVVAQLLGGRGKEAVALINWLVKEFFHLVVQAIKEVSQVADPEIADLVQGITQIVTTLTEPFAAASRVYTQTVADLAKGEASRVGPHTDTASGFGADYAFDGIVAPIAQIISQHPPSEEGTPGADNIQGSLGLIVSLHLVTWVINVVSNLTGIGTLKFFNSFTEVLLDAINTRGLARIAMKPYLNTYMTEPATAELNEKEQPKFLSEGQAMQGFLRGLISRDDALKMIHQAGFRDSWAQTIFTQELKYPPEQTIGKMVNLGWIDSDKAIQWLKLQGWSDEVAGQIYHFTRLTDVFSILRDAAERLEAQFAQGLIGEDDYRNILHEMMFSDAEVEALTIKGIATPKKKKKLSYNDVRRAYAESLVDLDFVETYLTGDGYTTEDAHLLMLLDFTAAAERDARKAVLAAALRLKAAKLDEEAAVAINKNEKAIAHAERVLAEKAKKLASSLGG